MSRLSPLTAHGGRIDAAAERFPDAPTPWIDLSTGINPRPYPTMAIGGADHGALPSRSALAALEAAAGAAFGMAAGAVAALPGSEIGLRLLGTIGLPAPIRVATPCYSTHLDAISGAAAVDGDAVSAMGHGTTLLANPNNPDGRVITPARLLDAVRASSGWLVVDEAFADAVEGSSLLPLLRDGDRVLVLRSFGKFYGLAGVRLGFACGHPTLVERLRERMGDWPVSAAAIAVGTAAYRDRAWAMQAWTDLAARVERLDAVLARHGYHAAGDCSLFRLIETLDAPALFERLGRTGILVRPFAEAPHRLRFGLPAGDAAFARLDRALGDN